MIPYRRLQRRMGRRLWVMNWVPCRGQRLWCTLGIILAYYWT